MLEDQREGPCGWSRMTEGGEWEEERVRRGHVSCGEDLGFYPEGGGSPGGLWAEEGQDLIWVLTCALWLLQEEHCGGQGQGRDTNRSH